MNTETAAALLTAEEVAGLLNVSERTLWRLLSAGKLPVPIRFGRNTRWKAADIQAWIAEGCPKTACAKP